MSASVPPLDLLALRREVLVLLGDGGTTDMAARVVDWFAQRHGTVGGLAEVAVRLGASRQQAWNWTDRHPDFPAPLASLASGRVYDLPTVDAWAVAHRLETPDE